MCVFLTLRGPDERAVWCVQLERLYHQRLLNNLTTLQEQWGNSLSLSRRSAIGSLITHPTFSLTLKPSLAPLSLWVCLCRVMRLSSSKPSVVPERRCRADGRGERNSDTDLTAKQLDILTHICKTHQR